MKNDKYWSGRAARRMYEYQAQADDVADSVSKAYISSTRCINDEMGSIFRTFQSDGLLSEAEAKRLLGKLPEDAELNRLKSIINTIDDSEKRRKLLAMINSPAYAYRIKRFEQLQKNIDEETTKLADFEQKQSKTHYTELAGEAYNRTIFDVQRGTGLSFSFAGMPKSRVEELLKQNWSGKLFSERIWDRAKDINKAVKEELLTQFMTGRSYRKTAKEIEQRMASGAIEARRLVRTESTYIANSAELEVYKECGVKQFKFLATLDLRTSDICAAMDGKIIKLEDASPGVNVPPLHPWCRSTTVAVIDGAVTDELKRRAKDPETGEYYEIPQDMTYEQWCKNLDKSAKSGIMNVEQEFSPRKTLNGNFSVDWSKIQDGTYNERLRAISNDDKVVNAIETRCKWALNNRNLSKTEELYAINLNDGSEVSKIIDQHNDFGVKRTPKFNAKLKEADVAGQKVLLIHNHPRGLPPSVGDINGLLENENVSGITAGHNGSIYYYTKPQKEILEDDWNIAMKHFKRYSEVTAMEKSLEILSKKYGFEIIKL